MDNFFSSQIDFILFFYGLAFILLGATCIAIARVRGRNESWIVLALFAFAHGGSEWLDLTALVISDSPVFALFRTAVMTGSFVLLMEFARQEANRFAMKAPGPWLYVPLLSLVVLGGAMDGVNAAGSVARYVLGFLGAVATSAIFCRFAKTFSGTTRYLAICAAVGFALYALAAGLIVLPAPFWPANVVNQNWFSEVSGIPIQLVRGLLACGISFAIWAIWGQQLISEVSSTRYARFLRQQFIWTLAAVTTILVVGWMLTEYLGGIYKQNLQREARGDINLLASRIAGETATIEGTVKILARARSVRALLVRGSEPDDQRAKAVLNLVVDASVANAGFILNGTGTVVASSDQREAAAPDSANYQSAPYFRQSMAGAAGYYFAFDGQNGERDYFASYPIRSDQGAIVGVVVLEKALGNLEADLRQFGRSYFLINPEGIVVLTNRPRLMLHSLWPLSTEQRSVSVRQSGTPTNHPMLEREVLDSTWTNFGGERVYVLRRNANHSQWSLAILTPIREIYASRVLGIVITLLTALMTLIYLFGRERWFHDNVQMRKRLKLQELAQDLRFQATTDPLTGLFNRLRFDEALASEISRSMRYKTPFSLVLYDIDHFKVVNDTHGHQTGDEVLTKLSAFVATNIRGLDTLARWGGEEFAITLPGCVAAMAYQAAEKLRAAIEQVGFHTVGKLTCSFGVAQYRDGDTAAALIARADDALYRAKLNGRNRVELAAPSAAVNPALAAVA